MSSTVAYVSEDVYQVTTGISGCGKMRPKGLGLTIILCGMMGARIILDLAEPSGW